MRLPLMLVLTAFASSPAAAQTASLHLALTVPVRCELTGMEATDPQQGVVHLRARCNAPVFDIVMDGALAQMPIQSATASQGQVSVHGNVIRLRTDHPGEFAFEIGYGAPLDQDQAIRAQILTL